MLGLGWLDACNRTESLAVEPATGGRICRWSGSSQLTAARMFPELGGRLLKRALEEWPIGFNDTSDPVTSDQPEVSVLIAIGGTERSSQLAATLASLRAQEGVEFEIIVVELGTSACLKGKLPSDVRYVFSQTDSAEQPFNKSWGLNIGARIARGTFLAIQDGDYLVPRRYLAKCVEMLSDFDGVRPHRFIAYFDDETSQRFLHEHSPSTVARVEKVVANNPTPIVVRADAYWLIGGHDESFFGWGGEDDEFLSRMRTLRFSEGGLLPVVHLWHPSAPKKVSGDRNRAQYESMMNVPVQERIARLLNLHVGDERPQPTVNSYAFENRTRVQDIAQR